MNSLQLDKIFSTGVNGDSLEEISILLTAINPDHDLNFLKQIHQDIGRIFSGLYDGYRASDTKYHDLQHTYSVALATARLLHGLSCEGFNISVRMGEITMCSAYFHDTGLILEQSDPAVSGAQYTENHEERSVILMQKYLREHLRKEEFLEDCATLVRCTDLYKDTAELVFKSEEIELASSILGSADIMAQMADRHYLERLPFLHQELVLGGMAKHDSALELMRHTDEFYNQVVRKKLKKSFFNTGKAMKSHFRDRWQIDRDLYSENIAKNIEYLRGVVEKCKSEQDAIKTLLKRKL